MGKDKRVGIYYPFWVVCSFRIGPRLEWDYPINKDDPLWISELFEY